MGVRGKVVVYFWTNLTSYKLLFYALVTCAGYTKVQCAHSMSRWKVTFMRAQAFLLVDYSSTRKGTSWSLNLSPLLNIFVTLSAPCYCQVYMMKLYSFVPIQTVIFVLDFVVFCTISKSHCVIKLGKHLCDERATWETSKGLGTSFLN